jgi:hypothetical protein
MRVQLADADQPHAQSAAVRFGALGRRYVLVAFADRPGSGLFPEARPKLTELSWKRSTRLNAGHQPKLKQHVPLSKSP